MPDPASDYGYLSDDERKQRRYGKKSSTHDPATGKLTSGIASAMTGTIPDRSALAGPQMPNASLGGGQEE